MASSTAQKPKAAQKTASAPKKPAAAKPKVETVDDLRMEAAGVKTAVKADFDNPESPVIADPAGTLVAPVLPSDSVKVKPGETVAMHEAHVQLSGPAIIAERLEKEAGPDGLPTELVAREQHERAARLEHQRIDGSAVVANQGLEGLNPRKTGPDAATGNTDADAA
jgi:hypothetical protein